MECSSIDNRNCSTRQSIRCYKILQCFELFVKANDIPVDRKKSVFLTAIGYDLYEVLTNIFEKPEQEAIKTLEAELDKHFNAKSLVIA